VHKGDIIYVIWLDNTVLYLFFSMETHCPFSRVATFWNHLGYDIRALSEALGHYGGIWVLKEIGCIYDITTVDIYFQAVTYVLRIPISRGFAQLSTLVPSRLIDNNYGIIFKTLDLT
jgi:hypothetical protein